MRKANREVIAVKRKLINLVRIVGLLGLFALAFWVLVTLGNLHQQTCPELYAPGSDDYLWLYMLLCALVLLMMPAITCIGGLLSGYRLHRMRILFIEIAREDKLRIRLTRRMGYGALLLPPRTDGTSPYKLALLCAPLVMAALAAITLALTAIFWHTGPARALMIMPIACVLAIVFILLPRRNTTDCLSRVLAFRSRDKRRAWECSMHITAALSDGKRLMDMPEEWFQQYPAEVAEDLYVSNCIINGSSRLIRQARFAEAYEMLRPLFDLAPAPETHQLVACVLLNGAICEALAELPPHCLSRLELPSVKYMTPASWTPRLRTAQYARALFLNHDEAEAAALWTQIEKDMAADRIDDELIRRMQEKAGLITKEDNV